MAHLDVPSTIPLAISPKFLFLVQLILFLNTSDFYDFGVNALGAVGSGTRILMLDSVPHQSSFFFTFTRLRPRANTPV